MLWSSKRLLCKSAARAIVFVACLALLGGASSCGGASPATDAGLAKGSVAEERAVLLLFPAAGEAEGWNPSGEPAIFSGEALFDHIDGGADIYFEYGFATLAVQQYEEGDKAVSLEIYGMTDPPAAFGIYSYNRHPTLSPVVVGGGGAIHPNGLFFWQDRYYVDIRRLGAATILAEEFMAVARAVERKIGAAAEAPAIIKLLRSENMVEHSVVFARGKLAINNQVYVAADDLFGLEKGEVAVIARYRFGRPEFSVIIAQYASEEACGRAFLRLRAHFLGEESTREEEFTATAMPGKHHAFRKAGASLLVVANADTMENARGMLKRISDSITAN